MTNININRRKFLKTASMIAAAAAVLPSVSTIAGVLTDAARLQDAERKVFEKVMKISLVTEGTKLVDPNTLPLIPTLEGALLAGMPPHIREGLRGGVFYFNDGPKEKYGKTFVELSDKDATQFIEEWADSDAVPHRALAFGLKKLSVLSYWAIPNTWAPLGYGGPVTEKWGLKSLGNTPEPTTV